MDFKEHVYELIATTFLIDKSEVTDELSTGDSLCAVNLPYICTLALSYD